MALEPTLQIPVGLTVAEIKKLLFRHRHQNLQSTIVMPKMMPSHPGIVDPKEIAASVATASFPGEPDEQVEALDTRGEDARTSAVRSSRVLANVQKRDAGCLPTCTQAHVEYLPTRRERPLRRLARRRLDKNTGWSLGDAGPASHKRIGGPHAGLVSAIAAARASVLPALRAARERRHNCS